MTSTITQGTDLEAHVDLIERVAEVLREHPLGSRFKLLLVPDELHMESGEVLVQTIDSDGRSARLVAKRAEDLDQEDVLAISSVVRTDDSYLEYLRTLRAASCLKRTDLHGHTVHIYD